MICSICNSAKTYCNYSTCSSCLEGLYQSQNQIIKQGEVTVKIEKIDAVIKYIQNNCSGFIAEDLLQLLEHLKKG